MRQKMQRLSYGDDDVDTITVNITEGNIIQRTERHADVDQPIKKYYHAFFFLTIFLAYTFDKIILMWKITDVSYCHSW